MLSASLNQAFPSFLQYYCPLPSNLKLRVGKVFRVMAFFHEINTVGGLMDGNLYHTIITFGEICYLTAHLTHFIYGYVASDICLKEPYVQYIICFLSVV